LGIWEQKLNNANKATSQALMLKFI